MVYPVSSSGLWRFGFHIMDDDHLTYTAKLDDCRPSRKAAKGVAVRWIESHCGS